MGIAERHYFHQPTQRNPFGNPRRWTVTSWLIAINIVVYIVDNVTRHQVLWDWGYFSVDAAIYGLQLWRFITMQFLHSGSQHIFQNMLALYLVGPSVEPALGQRKYLAFYLLCGIAGPLMCMAFSAIHFLHTDPMTEMIGASAGIMGVLIAAAVLNPNMRILFNFFVPMSMRTFAFILLGLAALDIMFKGSNAGGEAAHIGGAVAGYLLIKNPRMLNFADYRRGPRMRYRP